MRPAKLREDTIPKSEKISLKLGNFKGIDASDNCSFNPNYCSYCYNIKLENGQILNAHGVKAPSITLADGTMLSLPTSIDGQTIKKVVLFQRFNNTSNEQDDYLVALLANGKVHVAPTSTGEFAELPLVQFTSDDVSFVPYYFDGYDVILMASPVAGEFYLYDVRHTRVMSQAPGMRSICMYCDRVYGISSASAHTLCYSKELDPTEWTEGVGLAGKVSLLSGGGAIKKIITHEGYLIIFREHAVQKMFTYASPDNYTLSTMFETCDVIIPGSVTSLGDKVAFVAGKNIYLFDGYNVKSFHSDITPLIDEDRYAVGTYLRNTFFLAVRMKKYSLERIGDEQTESDIHNNAIFSFNLETGAVGISRGFDVAFISPIVTGRSSEVMIGFNGLRNKNMAMLDASGTLFGTALPKFMAMPTTDLSIPDKLKILRRAVVNTKFPMTLTIEMGGVVRNANFAGGGGPELKSIIGTGDTINIKVASTAAALNISDIMLVLEARGRYCGN